MTTHQLPSVAKQNHLTLVHQSQLQHFQRQLQLTAVCCCLLAEFSRHGSSRLPSPLPLWLAIKGSMARLATMVARSICFQPLELTIWTERLVDGGWCCFYDGAANGNSNGQAKGKKQEEGKNGSGYCQSYNHLPSSKNDSSSNSSNSHYHSCLLLLLAFGLAIAIVVSSLIMGALVTHHSTR